MKNSPSRLNNIEMYLFNLFNISILLFVDYHSVKNTEKNKNNPNNHNNLWIGDPNLSSKRDKKENYEGKLVFIDYVSGGVDKNG